MSVTYRGDDRTKLRNVTCEGTRFMAHPYLPFVSDSFVSDTNGEYFAIVAEYSNLWRVDVYHEVKQGNYIVERGIFQVGTTARDNAFEWAAMRLRSLSKQARRNESMSKFVAGEYYWINGWPMRCGGLHGNVPWFDNLSDWGYETNYRTVPPVPVPLTDEDMEMQTRQVIAVNDRSIVEAYLSERRRAGNDRLVVIIERMMKEAYDGKWE